MNRQQGKSWLLAALIAASGWAVPAVIGAQKALLQSSQAGPRIHKGGLLGGLLPKQREQKYRKGLPTGAAHQRRASIKARNVRRHKRNCGARS